MDPVSTILAALAAGAVAAAKDTASAVIKDGYEGLKSLLKKKFAAKPIAVAAVDAHASDTPEAEAVLRPALQNARVDDDPDLVEAARRLLAAADPGGQVARRYSVQVSGDVQGLVQGDHAQVTMTFGAPPSRSG